MLDTTNIMVNRRDHFMIDIHTHIIPSVDDGPDTLEEAMRMLEDMADEGISRVISTSHFNSPQYDVSAEQVISGVEMLKKQIKVQNIPIELLTGHEIRIYPSLLDDLLTGEALTLGNSRYVLIEFPSREVPDFAEDVFTELLSQNFIPVIAHPERNRELIEKPEKLYQFAKNGVLSQVTTGSLAGHFGSKIKETALHFVEQNLVHALGSDVHNLTSRPLLFNKGIDVLDNKGLSDQADILLENNHRIAENSYIIMQEPIKPKKAWWKVFQRV